MSESGKYIPYRNFFIGMQKRVNIPVNSSPCPKYYSSHIYKEHSICHCNKQIGIRNPTSYNLLSFKQMSRLGVFYQETSEFPGDCQHSKII